jgi:hypothetical protein
VVGGFKQLGTCSVGGHNLSTLGIGVLAAAPDERQPGAVLRVPRGPSYRGPMTESSDRPRPHGLGVVVVFDWALTAQLTTQAIATAGGHLGLAPDPVAIAGRLAGAILLLVLGEGMRRGLAALRLVQAAIMALITVLGLASAGLLLTGHGGRSLVFSAVIELTFAPWLLWALVNRQTARWFAQSEPRAPATRRSAVELAAWGAVWGVAVAWSQSL